MEYNFLDILFLPIIFFLGLVTSIDDIRFAKVRNKWIVFGFLYAVMVYMVLILWNELIIPFSFVFERLGLNNVIYNIDIRPDFLWKMALNSFLSILFGFLLWQKNIVAAGDVKLFFVFSLLLPIKYYWKSFLPIFPSFALLVNIFIIILIFILLRSLFYLFLDINKNGVRVLKRVLIRPDMSGGGILSLLGFVSVFLLFFWFRYFVNEFWNIEMGQYSYLFFVLMIIFGRRMIRMLSRGNNPLLIILIVLNLLITIVGFIVDHEAAVENIFITFKVMFLFVLLMFLISRFVNYYLNQTGVVNINIEDLEARMMINSVNMKELNADNKFVEKYGRILSGGINGRQAEAIIEWAKGRKWREIEIYKKFPLAPWIFVGVLSVIIFKESFLNIILSFIK